MGVCVPQLLQLDLLGSKDPVHIRDIVLQLANRSLCVGDEVGLSLLKVLEVAAQRDADPVAQAQHGVVVRVEVAKIVQQSAAC